MAHGIVPSREIGTLTGHACPTLNFPEAASQVFVAGDFVFMSSNYLTLCGTDPALIMGIALEPAHNTTAGLYRIGVALALEITLFGLSVYHATAANNVIEATDMYLCADIIMSAAGRWALDKAGSGDVCFRVLKFVEPLATVSGIVAGNIIAAHRQIGI